MKNAWILLLLPLLLAACKGQPEKRFVYFRNYSATFNDLHDKHLAAARRLGIEPLASPDEVARATRALKKITSNRRYRVDKLDHSIPYLVPAARDLLESIARNFQDSLEARRLPRHALIITSLLRTTSSVKSLRERNGNASTTSAHLHATTFDIAAARYAPAGRATAPVDKLKSVLAEVIRDLRAAGRCYARYEYKQTCFHVTAR